MTNEAINPSTDHPADDNSGAVDSSMDSAGKVREAHERGLRILERLEDADWEALVRGLQVSLASGRRDRWTITKVGRTIRPVVGENPQLVLLLISYCDDVDKLEKDFQLGAGLVERLKTLSVYADAVEDAISIYSRDEADWTDVSVRAFQESGPSGNSLVEVSILQLNGSSVDLRTNVLGYLNLVKALSAETPQVISVADDSDTQEYLDILESVQSSLSTLQESLREKTRVSVSGVPAVDQGEG